MFSFSNVSFIYRQHENIYPICINRSLLFTLLILTNTCKYNMKICWYIINNKHIKRVTRVSDLGVIFIDKLIFDSHINSCVR